MLNVECWQCMPLLNVECWQSSGIVFATCVSHIFIILCRIILHQNGCFDVFINAAKTWKCQSFLKYRNQVTTKISGGAAFSERIEPTILAEKFMTYDEEWWRFSEYRFLMKNVGGDISDNQMDRIHATKVYGFIISLRKWGIFLEEKFMTKMWSYFLD